MPEMRPSEKEVAMNDPETRRETRPDDSAEAPLDPATERVRRKMVRLLAVSVGIMLVGGMAVLAAVVYRVNEPREAALAEGASVPFALPLGARIAETSLDGDAVMVRVETDGGDGEVLVFDRATGSILSRHPLTFP